MSERRDAVREAAKAHTNLTMFHAVIAICEGGCFYPSPTEEAVSRIVKICKEAAGRELRRYDAASKRAAQAKAAPPHA